MQKLQNVVGLGLFPVNEILDMIQMGDRRDCHKIELLGYQVNVCSTRLQNFKIHGIDCIQCGLVGLFFSLEYHKNDKHGPKHPHLNLYALDKGYPILMTQDHIRPIAKGGGNNLNNLQTMCYSCNHTKGAKWGNMVIV